MEKLTNLQPQGPHHHRVDHFVPRSEDQFYSSAIKLTDEAILSLKKAVEENQLKDDQFYFLSYLLSRPALSLKELVKLSKVKSIPLYIPRT